MGKRRTDIDHKTRYDESDSDEGEEQQFEQEELTEQQKTAIQSRKKLVAKRSKNASGSLAPSPFTFGAKPPETGASEDKPAIFSGFKGFTAFKPTLPSTEPTISTSFSTTSEPSIRFPGFDKKEIESKIESPFANGPKTISSTNEPMSVSLSILNQSKPPSFAKSNGEHKKDDEVKEIKKTEELKTFNKSITESELKFITELNDLYERCYGANKRVYKLPTDALSESGDASDQETKYACLLAELNKHCSKWISKHVEESPLVLLTPVFVDYFNYLILLEKHFFPDSFKKAEPQKATDQKPSFFSSSLTNGTKLPVNGTNGHKEPEEITIIDDKAKENQDIYDTNKKMPSFFKPSTQPFAPISLGNNTMEKFGSTTTETSEKMSFFKSTEIKQTETKEIKEPEKPSIFASTTMPQATLPKITTSFGTPIQEKTEETRKEESTGAKPFFTPFSSSTLSQPSLFKFGSAAATTSSSITSTPSTIEISTEKKDETSVADESKKFSFTPGAGGFFSNLKKKDEETKVGESGEKPKETQTTLFKSFPLTSTPFSFSSTTPLSTTPSSTPSQPLFGFDSTKSMGSIFGSTPSTFGVPVSTDNAASSEAGGEAEEPYEPPKPESSDVKEEGAVYEKRMKLFYYNEDEKKFVDRGIGNLFIKPTKSGDSTQLIIRADTKLANILLNVKLSKVFPISKAGPKDISYLSIPNPAIQGVSDSKPCKFLFKVKTEDDANELLDKLNEHKK